MFIKIKLPYFILFDLKDLAKMFFIYLRLTYSVNEKGLP